LQWLKKGAWAKARLAVFLRARVRGEGERTRLERMKDGMKEWNEMNDGKDESWKRDKKGRGGREQG